MVLRGHYNSGNTKLQNCYRAWLYNCCYMAHTTNKGKFTWQQLIALIGCSKTGKWLLNSGIIAANKQG